ncbi:arylsulfatase [Parvibaculum sp.]|uniref:arylsulfatase n=1 Tax=Parvibaculum sp. TaxID=2024848 RepID=UPI0039193E7B
MKFLTAAVMATGLIAAAPAEAQDSRPNIVVILADDAGFSDFGAYGSEISTPNIDALAARGALFSNFHASPVCAPSRAMLLTGMTSHLAGVGNLPETLPPQHQGAPGYLGRLADDVVTVAALLRQAGYRTGVTGKWHLGHEPSALPPAHGFDRSFVLDASGADNWEQRSYLPIYPDAPWFEDGKPATLPEDFYSSKFIVDKAIDYIDEGDGAAAPFFAYLAFQAIHIPVQAPREFVEKYEGIYAEGWEALRRKRFENVVARGLVPEGTELGPMPDGLRAWETLSEREKALFAKSMAVNAAMLEAMDFHIGRFIGHLKQRGEFENTVFFILSDNGPEPNAPTDIPGFSQWLWWEGYSRDVETLGEKGTYAFIGPEFASAAASPGAFFKLYAGEGGIRVPFIVAGAGIPAAGQVADFSFITDIAPTILDLANVEQVSAFDGRAVKPMTGRSLMPLLSGVAPHYGPEDAVGLEAAGNAALFRGNYKLVRNMPPHGDGAWYLYDMAVDPGETRDLAAERPELFEAMRAAYERFARDAGVLDMPPGYEQMAEISKKWMEKNGWYIAAVLLALVYLAAAAGRGLRRVIRRS